MAPPSVTPGRVDFPVAVRGASTGFSVLLLGGLLVVLVGLKFPAATPLLGIVSAVVGFHVAARRIGTATFPALHGAVAAVLSYLLILPVVSLTTPTWTAADTSRLALNFALALSTGSLTGWINAQRRD